MYFYPVYVELEISCKFADQIIFFSKIVIKASFPKQGINVKLSLFALIDNYVFICFENYSNKSNFYAFLKLSSYE